jgi:hypothetical protein
MDKTRGKPMREAIKAIVESGGLVQYSYKRAHKDWFGECKIVVVYLEKKIYCVHWPFGMERYDTLDEALDFFMKTVFTRKNLAHAYAGIRLHKMTDVVYLDDLSEDELKRLCQEYNKKYFDLDFPFVKKKK